MKNLVLAAGRLILKTAELILISTGFVMLVIHLFQH